jgi:hypothetical protein
VPEQRRRVAGLACAVVLLAAAADAQIYTRVRDGVVEATNVPDTAGFRLTYPGKGTLIHSRGFRARYSGEYDHHIHAAASAFGVPAALVQAVIKVESDFDALAVSSKGARGLMQLMPAAARRFGVSDAFDARQNIFGGVQYLRVLLDLFQGDVSLALAGYNAGENAVLRYKGIPPYRETRNYVAKIQGLLGGASSWLPSGPRRAGAGAGATPAVPAASYAPSSGVVGRRQAAARTRREAPAKPRIYYRYHSSSGALAVSQQPPPDGVPYSLIRATDR